MNNVFSTVALSLLKKLPTGSGKYGFDHVKQYYSNANSSKVSLMFQPVTEENVFKILQSLNFIKATGLDKVPPRFLKDGAKFITAPLTYYYIINLSISQGKIPSELKSAKITHIYKKQNKPEAGNYRPISILSAVSKLFEKVVYDQLNKYLTDPQLLYEY